MNKVLERKQIIIQCKSLSDIPELKDITALEQNTDLVLEFSGWENKHISKVYEELEKKAEYAFVFHTEGKNTITISKYISRETILKHSDLIVNIAKDYRKDSEELVTKLAKKYHLEIDEVFPLNTFQNLKTDFEKYPVGTLDDDWKYFFHGFECGFKNNKTACRLEVLLTYPNEYGVLDPAFFGRYISTNPKYADTPISIQSEFHDGYIILKVMKEEQIFIPIVNQINDQRFEGLTLNPQLSRV